jgi:hypothetical protein
MSIETLHELHQEARRLFIAGSKLAHGDLRLGKLLPAVRKLGEASPVFNRVAQAVEQTVNARPEESDEKLLDLSALLHSILHTQGRTDFQAETTPLPGIVSFDYVFQPYRKLQPVIEALTEKGQGRLEVIRQACEEGTIRDYRLLVPVVAALDDSYAEIPELVEERIIPRFGSAALPVLLQHFRPDGGKGDSRKLRLIYRLQGEGAKELLLRIGAEGSPEVRSTAIELLGNFADQEAFLLSQANEKRKEIRRSALLALAALGTANASDRIYKALLSKDRELAVEAIVQSRDADLHRRVVAYARETREAALLNVKKGEEAWAPLQASLDALYGHSSPEAFALLQDLLCDQAFVVHAPLGLQRTAVRLLVDDSSEEARSFTISLADRHKGRFLSYSLHAAVESLDPEQVYERFSKYAASEKRTELGDFFKRYLPPVTDGMTEDLEEEEYGRSPDRPRPIDRRWLGVFIRIDELEAVCRLAWEADALTVEYLKAKCAAKKDFTSSEIIHALLALFKLGCPEAPEVLMDILESGKRRMIYYLFPEQALLLRQLPGAYGEKLAVQAEKLHYPSVREQVLEIADELRLKTEAASIGGSNGKGFL